MLAKAVLLLLLSGIASSAEEHSCKTIDSSMLLQSDVTTADTTIHSGIPQMLHRMFTKVFKEKVNDTQCTLTPNAAIDGHNREHLAGQTVASCSSACSDRSWCKSFDWYKNENKCDLSDKSASDVGGLKIDYSANPYDHYSCDPYESLRPLSSASGDRHLQNVHLQNVLGEATVSASGDPHLQNVLGERFDLVQPGIHTLLNIPQGAVLPETILFRMTALAQNFGSSCTETYFQALNLTGQWVVAASRGLTSSKEKSAQAVGGMRFSVGDNEGAGNVNADSAGNSGNHSGIQLNNAYMARWLPFGPVAVKVVRGHLPGGFAYLNVFLKNVKHAGHVVGGLLGQDDHRKEATPSVGCKKLMALSREATATIKPGSIAKAE